MSTKKIIIFVTSIIVAILAVTCMSMYFSYNNKEVALRKEAVAQEGKIEAVYDKMWKVVQQKAQVTDEYKDAFHKIYKDIIGGRYEGDKGDAFMKWITESNPEFDASVYKDLMASIEVLRAEFTTAQTRMLDIIREHETLCNTFPGKWFIKDKSPIEYEVISSTTTKQVMETRLEDNIDLFKKDE
jgi:hypothetical protein